MYCIKHIATYTVESDDILAEAVRDQSLHLVPICRERPQFHLRERCLFNSLTLRAGCGTAREPLGED